MPTAAHNGGVLKYAAFDIESTIGDYTNISHNGVLLGQAATPGRRSSIFGIGFVNQEGKSAGYHYLENMPHFNEADYANASSGKTEEHLVRLRELTDDEAKKVLGTNNLPADWRELVNEKAGIKRVGSQHFVGLNEGQKNYLSDVIAPEGARSYAGTLTEAATIPGAKAHKSQRSFIEAVIENLKTLRKDTDTLIGFNSGAVGDSVSGFDIPKMEKIAHSVGLKDEMTQALGAFKTPDVQKAYQKKLRGLGIDLKAFPGANRFNLDVAGRAYGRYDPELLKMVKDRGVHGADKDSQITRRVFQAMKQFELTKEDHLIAVATAAHDGIRHAQKNQYAPLELHMEARTTSVDLLREFKGLKPTGASQPNTGAKSVAAASSSASAAMAHMKKIPKSAYWAAGAIAGIALVNNIAKDDTLSDINETANYLLHGTARRDDWISASALQLKGNNRFFRMVDPGMEDEIDRPTDREDKRERKVQNEGTATHAKIQDMLESQGLGEREYYIEDKKNKVFGYVDFMTKQGIPLEIKTTDYRRWSEMTEPHQEHINQINFDTMATDSPYGYIMYAPRGMPEKQKTFLVYRDPSRYAQNVTEAREIQKTYAGMSTSSENLSGFRPLSSLFNHKSNDRVANMNAGYNRAKIIDQKTRYSNLPVGQSYSGRSQSRHSNENSRAAGGTAYG